MIGGVFQPRFNAGQECPAYRTPTLPLVNPVRNSNEALNPAGIILKCYPAAAAQRGIFPNGVKGGDNSSLFYKGGWTRIILYFRNKVNNNVKIILIMMEVVIGK